MARLYRPLSAGPDDVLPVAFYFHGGGWCVGDIPSYDVLCRELANSAAAVLSVDYRLAPEHPFPARWTTRCMRCLEPRQRRAARHRSGRFALAGDSAGGTLSAVTALQLRNERPAGALQLLIYPCTDILSQRRRGAPLPTATFWIPRASPGSSRSTCPTGRLAGLARVAAAGRAFRRSAAGDLHHAGCDPLTDDCKAYARARGRRAGEVHEFDGMVHGFFTLGKLFRRRPRRSNGQGALGRAGGPGGGPACCSDADEADDLGAVGAAAPEGELAASAQHDFLAGEQELPLALDLHEGAVAAAVDQHELVAAQFDLGVAAGRLGVADHQIGSGSRPMRALGRVELSTTDFESM
jgi:acetyl esterase